MRKAVVIVAIILAVVVALNVRAASAAPTHYRQIPAYVLTAARVAGVTTAGMSNVRCGWTNYYHNHIRCRMTVAGMPGTMLIHRVGYHRYLMVCSVYGVVVLRQYKRF